jgi:hypothetical protein
MFSIESLVLILYGYGSSRFEEAQTSIERWRDGISLQHPASRSNLRESGATTTAACWLARHANTSPGIREMSPILPESVSTFDCVQADRYNAQGASATVASG